MKSTDTGFRIDVAGRCNRQRPAVNCYFTCLNGSSNINRCRLESLGRLGVVLSQICRDPSSQTGLGFGYPGISHRAWTSSCGRGFKARLGDISMPNDSLQGLAADTHVALSWDKEPRCLPSGDVDHRVFHRTRQFGLLKMTHNRNRPVRVVHQSVPSVCAGNHVVQPTATTFKNLAVSVNQHVVSDIAPTPTGNMVLMDAANDIDRLRFVIGVRPGRVVQRYSIGIWLCTHAALLSCGRFPSASRNYLWHWCEIKILSCHTF